MEQSFNIDSTTLARLGQYKINFMDSNNNIINTIYETSDGIQSSILEKELKKYPDTAAIDVIHVKHATIEYLETLLENYHIIYFDKKHEAIDWEVFRSQHNE